MIERVDFHWLTDWHQADTESNKIASVGQSLFAELCKRDEMSHELVSVLRHALVEMARRVGVEVPAFMGDDASLREASIDQVKAWLVLVGVLEAPLAVEDKGRTAGAQGRGSKTRGGKPRVLRGQGQGRGRGEGSGGPATC